MEYFWIRESVGDEPNDDLDLIGLLKVNYRKEYYNRLFLYGEIFIKNRGGGFEYYRNWSCVEDIVDYEGTQRDWDHCEALRIFEF